MIFTLNVAKIKKKLGLRCMHFGFFMVYVFNAISVSGVIIPPKREDVFKKEPLLKNPRSKAFDSKEQTQKEPKSQKKTEVKEVIPEPTPLNQENQDALSPEKRNDPYKKKTSQNAVDEEKNTLKKNALEKKSFEKKKLYEKTVRTPSLILINQDHFYIKLPEKTKVNLALVDLEGELWLLTNLKEIDIHESLRVRLKKIYTHKKNIALKIRHQMHASARQCFQLVSVKNGWDIVLEKAIPVVVSHETFKDSKTYTLQTPVIQSPEDFLTHPSTHNRWHFYFTPIQKERMVFKKRPEVASALSQGGIVFRPLFRDISWKASKNAVQFHRLLDFVNTRPNKRLLIEKTAIPFEDIPAQEYRSLKYKIYQQNHLHDIPKRLKLVGYYLANAQGIEAHTELQLLQDIIPAIVFDPSYALLLNVSSALSRDMNLTQDAVYQKPSQRIQLNSAESLLWEHLFFLKRHDVAERDTYPLAPYIIESMMAQYPERVRNHVLIQLLEHATYHNMKELVTMLLDKKWRPHVAEDREIFDYYRALHLLEDNNWQEAHEIFKGLHQYSKNLKLTTQAQLQRIRIEHKEKLLKPDIIADKLHHLSRSWRGDRLGYNILKDLALIHESLGASFKALDANIRLLQDYPSYIEKEDQKKKISMMFLEILAQNVERSPLKVVAFYERVKEYLSPSSHTDQIMERVIDSMKALNLLEEAAVLSQTYAQHFRTLEKRAPWLLKAAQFHSLNKQSAQALKAFEPVESLLNGQSEYHLLKARCLMNIQKSEEAFKHFEKTEDVKAWHVWYHAALSIKDYQKALEALKRIHPKNTQEPETIYRLALCYHHLGDAKALKELREKYLTLMDGTSFKMTFRMLSQSTQKFDSALHRSQIESIMEEVEEIKSFSNPP
jgi:hypothetical protein